MLGRREFLSTIGTGIATLLLTPLIDACSSDSGPPTSTSVGTTTPTGPTGPTGPTPTEGSGCDGAGETSTRGFCGAECTWAYGHTHTLCVPTSDLSNPPAAGAIYTTSTTGHHEHVVILSQAQLTTVAKGGSVTVTTSTVSDHTHDFTVQMSGVQPTPEPIN